MLKDKVKVGDTFFFHCEDHRENHRWNKVGTVTEVKNKFFTVSFEDSKRTEKCSLVESEGLIQKGILASIKRDAGASVYGYDNENTVLLIERKKELYRKISKVNFVENLPTDIFEKIEELVNSLK